MYCIFIHTSNDIKKLLETFFTVWSNNCEASKEMSLKSEMELQYGATVLHREEVLTDV